MSFRCEKRLVLRLDRRQAALEVGKSSKAAAVECLFQSGVFEARFAGRKLGQREPEDVLVHFGIGITQQPNQAAFIDVPTGSLDLSGHGVLGALASAEANARAILHFRQCRGRHFTLVLAEGIRVANWEPEEKFAHELQQGALAGLVRAADQMEPAVAETDARPLEQPKVLDFDFKQSHGPLRKAGGRLTTPPPVAANV